MKKIILIATACAAYLSAYGLPTYEPFTEYAGQIAASPINLVVTYANGTPVGTNANASISNCLDLATGGYTAPGGELWGILNFSGTGSGNPPYASCHGLDIALVTNNNIFTSANLASLLPSTFPGFPASGGIAPIMENPAQPLMWFTNAATFTATNIVGNSAVLKFAQDITRPANGTPKTLFVSYLFNLAQAGQLGTGNNGRYLAFVAATNLVEGTNLGPTVVAFTNWSAMFNNFGTSSNHYACHGLLGKTGGYYIGACDSAKGLEWGSSPLTGSYGTPLFVVGAYVLNSGANQDTNIMWVNPSTATFGGATPPATSIQVWTTNAFTMSDLGGLVLIDRQGNGASGGVGTNYIANLLIGSTWSYVTGGPEFTNQPPANTTIALGGTTNITAGATAAGQSVSYQWVKITNGGATTNNVNPGAGGAGGAAIVSGQNTATLTLTGISAGDAGSYQLVATASSTGYTLNSATAAVVLPDPLITANPANVTTNYGNTVTFTATATTGNAPLHYGWYLNGQPLQNGTLPGSQTVAVNATGTTAGSSPFTITLTLSSVDYLAAGSYYLVVTNNINLQASSTPATLAVNDPIITAQPANPNVAAGGTATFTVAAAGSPTLSYNWYEGTPPGGTQLLNGNTTASGASITISSGSGTSTLTLGGSGVQDADNGSYYCAVTGSASLQTINSATATLTVQDALTIAPSVSPAALTERVGDHLAFTVGVTGGGPQIQWRFNGSPIAGATTTALVLTSIQTGSNGIYSVVVSNLLTPAVTNSATLTVINSTILPLWSTNLVVSRVGDGAQALSGATGNTIYLDQYTNNGTSVTYVNTAQVPDEAIGSSYPTGGPSSLTGSPALLVQGAGSDAANEAMLTLSGVNQEYLGFAGYCQQYPYTGGSDVTVANLNTGWRGLATINAFGIYSLAYTNYGLYSAGPHTICSMVTSDGTNFWTTGQAGSGTVKYVNSTQSTYANGTGIPSSTGDSAGGGRVVQFVNGVLVVSDAVGNPGGSGLYATSQAIPSGNVVFTNLLPTGGLPADFAFSPDNQTIYVAQSGVFNGMGSVGAGNGGIERWDSNGSGGYNYNYTLPVLPGEVSGGPGAQGLTVDFSANSTWSALATGAKIYATSAGAATNSLVQVVDNGNPGTTPPTVTVLATASPNQALRGVRFGPAAIAPAIAGPPQTNSVPLGNSATFTIAANGSAPLFYQWYFGSKLLAGATQSTFTTNNVSYASAGNYILVVSNLTTQTASVTNVLAVTAGAPTITPIPLPSYTETAGDHLAWGPTITGTQPVTNYWYLGSALVQSNVTPPANGSLALTNISAANNNGTYRLYVTNLYGWASSTGSLTVTASRQALYPTNLVVARVGDGAQTLSGATGNTLYLDQFRTNGALVNTIQIPDEGTGQPYGTGSSSSSSMPFGSPALLFAGGNVIPQNDAGYEAFLTLSPNSQTLNFAGYCQAYPFAGTDVSASTGNGGVDWRGIGAVSAYGSYTLAWTNSGLYSGGNHQIHAVVDLDGNGTNWYSTGEAGSGPGVRYLNTNFQPANGMNLVTVAGTFLGTRVAQIIGGNLVFSDAAAIPSGLYGCSGLPTTANATASLLITEPSSPMDFAASPDGQTVYITDNAAFGGTSSQAGGIQRYDGTPPSSYTYTYTLGTGTGSSVGARGLTVDWSSFTGGGATGTGAKLYATTAEPSGNRLIEIVDTGASSSATVLATAGPNQILAGVRFGPVIVPLSIAAQPQPASAQAGSGATFSVDALGSGPLTYQWYFQPHCSGSFNPILDATNASYTIGAAGSVNVGCYYVMVTNPGGSNLQSDTVTFSLSLPPQFVPPYPGPGNGFQLNFTGPAGSGYTIWQTADVSLTPVQSTWAQLTGGTFSGGTDSYTDPNGGTNPQQFYIITMP